MKKLRGKKRYFRNLWEEVNYLAAINTDFITPLYDGDDTRYIYTGAAGKLLPCFYIYGREVHVGDTLAGIDPNFIASELTNRIPYMARSVPLQIFSTRESL